MTPRRTFLSVIVAVAAIVGGYGIYHASIKPVIPAVVVRDTDAHRMLSPAIGARVDRFLHDRPPTDRTKNPHLIALTFDDGPYPVETGLLLDVLAELRVPATFFLIGHDTEMYPGLAKRIVADGHEIIPASRSGSLPTATRSPTIRRHIQRASMRSRRAASKANSISARRHSSGTCAIPRSAR